MAQGVSVELPDGQYPPCGQVSRSWLFSPPAHTTLQYIVSYSSGTDTNKQPISARYLGHVTGYQPIRDQYFLNVLPQCSITLPQRYLRGNISPPDTPPANRETCVLTLLYIFHVGDIGTWCDPHICVGIALGCYVAKR
eukprot:sb/3474437/